jgi:hypothetical protein
MRTDTKLKSGIAVGIAGVLAVGGQAIAANGPGGSPTPANKAIASGAKTAVFGPQTAVTLLSATLRTSKPTDLMIQTTLECSILTKVTTGSEEQGPANPSSPVSSTGRAAASIRGWIEIDDDENNGESPEVGAPERIVPIESASQPPQDPAESGSGTVIPQTSFVDNSTEIPDDAATYCNRAYERTVTDRENPYDGIDEQTDYIDTKTATGFNWVLLNAGSGVHYVRLVGEMVSGAQGSCVRDTTTPAAAGGAGGCTSAYVGHRTMIVEPTKMSNDAVISPTASS